MKKVMLIWLGAVTYYFINAELFKLVNSRYGDGSSLFFTVLVVMLFVGVTIIYIIDKEEK